MYYTQRCYWKDRRGSLNWASREGRERKCCYLRDRERETERDNGLPLERCSKRAQETGRWNEWSCSLEVEDIWQVFQNYNMLPDTFSFFFFNLGLSKISVPELKPLLRKDGGRSRMKPNYICLRLHNNPETSAEAKQLLVALKDECTPLLFIYCI